jgi:acyl-CoA synthetase (AMP-forming)/AMP-acid ligase II
MATEPTASNLAANHRETGIGWLLERFASAPEGLNAFVHHGTSTGYAQVAELVQKSVRDLQSQGIRSGHVVALLADFSPDVFCLILALAQLRCVVVPMTRDSVVEETDALSICGCDYKITVDPDGVQWSVAPHCVAVEQPMLRDFQLLGSAGLLLFSSGSTGKPKCMLHNFEKVMDKFRVKRASMVAIPFLMLDHFGGINTLLAITSSLGTVVTTPDRSVKTICEAIQNYRVTLLPTTPSFLTLMAASDLASRYDFSSLQRITYGTETMPQSTLDRVRALLPGVELQQTYGLSEVGVLRSQSRPDGSLWVRLGGEGFETQVREGVLWVRSQYRMVGYLNAPSAFDAEGWFNTQDQVEVDGDYFKILGRVTDLINVGGQKVYPAEVEDVILAQANIAEVVVCGEKHALLGHIVVAKVVLHTPEPLDALRLRIRKACQARLSAFKVPVKVELLDQAAYSARFKKVRRQL